jgi:hypothetical protein
MQRGRVAPNIPKPVTFVHLLPQRAIFLLELAALHGAREQQFNLVEIERLGDKIVCTAFHRLDCDIDRAVGGHHDADWRTRHFQGAIDQRHSVFAAEAKVSEKDVNLLAFEYVYRACNIGGDIDIVIVLKQTSQPVARMLLVIHNENGGL